VRNVARNKRPSETSAKAWQRQTNARELLKLLPDDFSRRKLRWFVWASVRGKLPRKIGKRVSYVLRLGEQIADDEAHVDPDTWLACWQELDENRVNGDAMPDGHADLLTYVVGEDVFDEARWFLDSPTDSENEQALALLREIFGNPFRPVDFVPWRTDTVVALARQMYKARDFGAMPILADALQDAGCTNAEVLNHCRDTKQTHVRGCWVVDGGLGLV
jgi:hypothetical protein